MVELRALGFSLFQITQTLYWAMFGLVDLDAITLVEDHGFTEFAGRMMFGVYNYLTVIVLLNMLIAMMNNSYQIISVSALVLPLSEPHCSVHIL